MAIFNSLKLFFEVICDLCSLFEVVNKQQFIEVVSLSKLHIFM